MITVENAESYLKAKIGENIGMTEIWGIFKSFGREPVQGEDEVALLFQCGVFNFTGEELFHFDFVRQFSVSEDGEYSHMEQLYCEFLFAPTDELIKMEAAEWYFDSDGDIDDFFTKVESLKEFIIPLRYSPLRLNVYQEVV